jgi:hypothetical protein
MSNDEDYETARVRLAANDAAVDAHREEMWRVVSRSWTEQVARRRRRRVATAWGGAGLALAATFAVGILIGRGSTGPAPVDEPVVRTPRTELPMAYRVVVGEHFKETETVLALFAAESAADADVSSAARSLAATTRLLIGSRAGRDPEVRRMLLELEILLVQIARLADERDAAERQAVREGLEDTAVLPRLRQMIPQDAGTRI